MSHYIKLTSKSKPALQTENYRRGDRVFGVAAPRVWNDLLADVTSA